MNEIKIGSIIGTGSLLILTLGFIPDYFEIFDQTNGNAIWKWSRGMPAGTAVKITTDVATLAANGISEYNDPDADLPQGVMLGTDVSVSGATLYYQASRSGPGAQG